MARYMSQDLFTTLAIKLAWTCRLNVNDEARRTVAIDDVLTGYRRFYLQDPFESELWHTVDALDQWLVQAYPHPPEQMAWMSALRGALVKYTSNGTLKRRPLFTGLWYTSARSAPPDRPRQCMLDIARCHGSMQAGKIPL